VQRGATVGVPRAQRVFSVRMPARGRSRADIDYKCVSPRQRTHDPRICHRVGSSSNTRVQGSARHKRWVPEVSEKRAARPQNAPSPLQDVNKAQMLAHNRTGVRPVIHARTGVTDWIDAVREAARAEPLTPNNIHPSAREDADYVVVGARREHPPRALDPVAPDPRGVSIGGHRAHTLSLSCWVV